MDDLPLETQVRLLALIRQHQAANAEYRQSLTPDPRLLGIVFYVSAAIIFCVLIGDLKYSADFFMGMAALPFLISGGMLIRGWLTRRRTSTATTEAWSAAYDLGFWIKDDGTCEPKTRYEPKARQAR